MGPIACTMISNPLKALSLNLRQTTLETGISFFDQAILSTFNFLIGIILIKRIEPAQYGQFVFAVSLVLLVVGFQNALVTTQLTVIGPKKAASEKNSFCAALFVGQYFYWLPLAIVFIIAIAFSGNYFPHERGYQTILVIMAVSCLGTLCREFYRSYFYFQLKPKKVLAIDLRYIAIFAIVWMLVLRNQPGQHYWVLGLLGLSSMLCSYAGYKALSESMRTLTFQRMTLALKECWINGKWALWGVIVTWLQTQCYIYLTASMLGSEQTAIIHASRLLLMPVALLHMSYGRLFRARWAHAWHREEHHYVFSNARVVLWSLLGIISVYAILLYAAQGPIIHVLFKDEYADCGAYILLWTLFFLFQIQRSNASLLLQVLEKFRIISIFFTITTILTIASGIVLIKILGPTGSLWSMIAGEALLTILLSYQVAKCRLSIYRSA